MKKLLKIMACAMMVLAMAGMMSSCKKNKVTETEMQVSYCAEILEPMSASDVAKLNAYFKSKGAIIPECYQTPSDDCKTYTVSGVDEAECVSKADALAKADFETISKGFSVEEVHALLETERSFKYYWFNRDNVEDVVGSWICPEKPVPSEFGTLTVDNDTVVITKAYKNAGTVSGNPATQITLYNKDLTYAENLFFTNLQESGMVPVGQFEFETGSYSGHIKAKDISYNIISGVCNITEENNSYTIVSSGKAEKDGVTINFELNCTNVVFFK